jgi:uncharacterized membrane protein
VRRPTRRGASWDRLRGALWVLPTASVLCSLAAGAMLAAVEVGERSWLGPLLFQGTAADARDLLIVVSATMITVTGLVFTLTVVALQIASTQFSPRLLRNFMRDRGNQVVLSIFVSTFAYATAGLHTVGARAGGQAEFVPRLAVSGSLFLALLSLAALVYFIHHIARSIQIDTIMAGVERETLAVIDDTYPDRFQDAGAEERAPDPPVQAVAVAARRSGYLQAVDLDGLLAVALEHGLVLRLAAAVGDHVIAGTPLAWAWPAAADGRRPQPEGLVDPLDRVVQIGMERTMLQDVAFGIRQLADIANKALSPAVNDPYTGVQSLQHLSVVVPPWPAAGSATTSAATPPGRCGRRCRSPASPTTCGSRPPRSGATAPRSRGWPAPCSGCSAPPASRWPTRSDAPPWPGTSAWSWPTPSARRPNPPTPRRCSPRARRCWPSWSAIRRELASSA